MECADGDARHASDTTHTGGARRINPHDGDAYFELSEWQYAVGQLRLDTESVCAAAHALELERREIDSERIARRRHRIFDSTWSTSIQIVVLGLRQCRVSETRRDGDRELALAKSLLVQNATLSRT